ncbi:hypothetical protein JTE90_017049 [Oedothorax gibbosus]|uniref:CAP-Gly domain-containing protein n=1 Tax=Oedothorax gibbosus TaxID=931172 RepID=A0AAV6UP32_9ARAC|nr:hypothetical protein JTE90_017049 [Oedothorax gibbosus]
MSTSKPAKGIPVPSKIPKSGPDSGTHSRSSSVSNLTTASDVHSEMGDATSENTHGFKVEDRVWVNGSKPGVIKFLGKTDFAPGLWAGVLLDDLIGKNDGSVAGVKYFTCEPLRGIFARPSKLTRTAGDVPTATIDSAKSPRTGSAATPLSSRLAGSTASLSSARSTCCSRLRCGERVMVSSTTGMKPGILRFLGETDFAKGEWAGIELDEPVGKNDGSVAGKRYFTCRMKYGLFSPLHKVSRAGGTATPRAPSVRGTPLIRSTSRDSLSSSVSNSSKLKARSTGGVGVMTTSRALEEALREKEQHIEQLLKEHEMERAEIAKVSVRCEEFANKCSELLDQQQNAEKDKKEIEVQLVSEKRKIEDLQFQLDEEKIIKSDLETQMSQHKQLLERLEGYLNKKMDARFINIKEILERKEKLTEVSDEQSHDPQIGVYKEKIASLESGLANSITEKDEILKTLEATKLLIDTSKSENEGQMSSLKATIQEKDDIISNLKGELTSQLEKLTQFIEDNKNLNDQINLQAAEAKGQTDEIIKEMGEKIKSLTEELNAKNTQIQEHESSLQEKDSHLSEHSNRLQSQAQQLTEAQNQNKALQDDLGQKISELNEKATKLSSLEGEISALKSQLSSTAGEKDEKILSLGKEIGLLTNNLQEQEVKFVQKQTEVCNLEDTVKELSEINTKILGELKEKQEYVSTVSKDSCEKMSALQTEINNLKQEREDAVNNLEKELQTKKAEYEKLSQDISEKTTALSEKESQISSLSQTLSQKESEFTNMQNELSSVKQTCEVLSNEKVQSLDSIKTKEELLSELEKQLNDLKSSEEKTRNEILETQKEVETLQIALKLKNEENDQLNSKLELAERNVEMLNKDSSQHVMTLQSELSKLKEENIKDKTAFDQKISELENENSKLSKDINEKNAALTEKTGVLSSFKQELHAKEDRVSNLTTRIESLEQELSALSKAKEDLIISHSKELGSTKGQLESELKIKDAKLSEIQEEYEKLTKTLTEKNSALQANEEALTALQVQIKEKESDMLNTSALSEKLEEELDALSKDKQSIIEEHQKQVEAIKEKHKLELKKKDELLEEFQSKISTSNELLENKDKALLQKESENNALKNALQNKDSQFDEISKMIEGSQAQLLQLTERNENNEKLLQTKEAFINDFKAEKERQILELEEVLS